MFRKLPSRGPMPTNRLAEEEEPGAENAGGERDVRPLGPWGEVGERRWRSWIRDRWMGKPAGLSEENHTALAERERSAATPPSLPPSSKGSRKGGSPLSVVSSVSAVQPMLVAMGFYGRGRPASACGSEILERLQLDCTQNPLWHCKAHAVQTCSSFA